MNGKRKKRVARVLSETSKFIGVPSLDDGGRKYPTGFPGGSGILDEDEKGPAKFQGRGKVRVPADGLVLAPNWMAESVVTGKKKMVVKTKPFEIANRNFLIIHNRLAYGVAEFGEMMEMDEQSFRDSEMEHLISPALRDQWCTRQEGWCTAPYYAWSVKRAVSFDSPRPTNVPAGPQVLVRNVVLKQIKTNPRSLFLCAELPTGLKTTLGKLAGRFAEEKGVRPEVVDHVTLLFLPSDSEVSEEEARVASEIAASTVKGWGAISAKFSGLAYFDGVEKDGEKKTALVALVDAPGLAELHVALKTSLTAAGFAGDDQVHGFVPHATLVYLRRGDRIRNLPQFSDEFQIETIQFVHSEIQSLILKSVLEKIQNVDTYDPSKVTDAVLRDDFRIVLAWFATWKKNPQAFKYNRKILEYLLRTILEEAVKRGPQVIRFDPEGMSESVRDFFNRVAGTVGIPSEQLKSVSVDAEPEHASSQELLRAHDELHFKYRLEARGKGDPDLSVEDVVNLHALVVDEMRDRNIEHPPPPDDGLDSVSHDFERTDRKLRKDYQRILHSGDQLGRLIHIDEVLKHFKSFKLRKPYIYLVGGLANHGTTEGDIDILVKDSPDLPEDFKHALHFRLGRALPGELADRLSIHFDEFHGPFTNFVELYDLTFERVNPKNEVKLMSLEGAHREQEPTELDFMDEREKVYAELSAELWEDDDVPTE